MTSERRVLRATGFVPVEAKLRPPSPRNGYVLRGQIVDRLLDSSGLPVVLVTAPPGYGKTVAVMQWAEEDDRPFAWLSIDESDNDPIVLFTYLLLALQRIEPVDAGILATLTGSERSVSEIALPRLGRMLAKWQHPFVFVLDEADALTSRAALRIVNSLADHLPEGSQLVVIARAAPPLDWSGLRAKRRLLEIGTDDLRLSRAEALALVEAAGLHLAPQDLDALLERTEGWSAATYLAALAMSRVPERRRPVSDLLGSDSVVASYLRDELLARLSSDDQTFLRRTSILTRLCGPLCDAVLSTTGSDAVLQRLTRSNALVLRLDDQGQWYRVHQLFGEVLKSELYRREPQITRRLHAHASHWLETTGDFESAIFHAVAAAEIEHAARLIWSQSADFIATGRVAALERWLDSFTPRQVAGHAKLALTATWCALQRGRSPDPWLSAAERGAYDATRKGEAEAVAAATRLLHVAVGQNGAAQMGADARLALELEGPEDPWRPMAGLLDAVSTYLTGHVLEAQSKLVDVDGLARAFGNPQVRARAMVQSALIAVDDNDWESAEALLDHAFALMGQYSLDDLVGLIPAHCARALLTAKRGASEQAAALARQCMSRIAMCAYLPPWEGLQCRYLIARTELMLGDPAAARTLLSEANGLLPDIADATQLRDSVSHLWSQIEKMPLMAGGKTPALTTAELRVLQLLPTHYSFEQIGRQLFVSRNTVKTQAISAYRKLGVSSRTEAVERAYALGLMSR